MNKKYLRSAYDMGWSARENGYERISPIQGRADESYWYAGYDGINFIEFHRTKRKQLKEIKSSLGYSRIGLNNI